MKGKSTTILCLVIGIIFLFQSINAQTWSTPKRLTWNAGSSRYPVVAVCQCNNPYVVWFDNTPGAYTLYFRKALSTGTTWLAVKRLTWSAANAYYPHIAVDTGNNPHVVWEDYRYGSTEIVHRTSTDAGSTWGVTKRITWAGGAKKPKIALGPNNQLHVVWASSSTGNNEIMYKQSADFGATWSALSRITWTSGSSYSPSIAVDINNHPHIVWDDDSPGNNEIYYKRSTDGGTTWLTTKRLTYNSGSSVFAFVALDSNNNPYVVWYDQTPGNAEIFFKKSTDGGATWSTLKRLTWNSGWSKTPVLDFDSSGHLYLLWQDNTPGDFEVYIRNSTDGGMTWSALKRLTWNSGDSSFPYFVIDPSDDLHVVWHDSTPGNNEIYYKNRK